MNFRELLAARCGALASAIENDGVLDEDSLLSTLREAQFSLLESRVIGHAKLEHNITVGGLTVNAGVTVLSLVERIRDLMADNADLRVAPLPPVAEASAPPAERLAPLPKPRYQLDTGNGWMAPTKGYTAEQMQSYALEAIAARP